MQVRKLQISSQKLQPFENGCRLAELETLETPLPMLLVLSEEAQSLHEIGSSRRSISFFCSIPDRLGYLADDPPQHREIDEIARQGLAVGPSIRVGQEFLQGAVLEGQTTHG